MRPTIPMLTANVVVLESANDELRAENERLRKRIADLEDQRRGELRDQLAIHENTMRLRWMDQQNAHGVPCHIKDGVVVHSATHEVLETPGQFLPR